MSVCIGIPKHLMTLGCSDMKRLLTFFWLLVFQHEERERDTQFLLCWLFLHHPSVNSPAELSAQSQILTSLRTSCKPTNWTGLAQRQISTSISTRLIGWSCRIHWLHLCRGVRLPKWVSCGPIGWGCRIHWLHLCRGVRLPKWVSCGPIGWGCRILWLHLCRGVRLPKWVSCGPIGWGCRIHWLHLCRGVRLPKWVSCGPIGWGCRILWLHLFRRISPPTTSMSVLDKILNNLMVRLHLCWSFRKYGVPLHCHCSQVYFELKW